MPFKKHNWVKYGNNSNIVVELIIKEGSGMKIDSFRFNNNNDYSKISKVLEEKYGFKREVVKEIEETKEQEKNWLEKDSEW